jgi:hypothetical protein
VLSGGRERPAGSYGDTPVSENEIASVERRRLRPLDRLILASVFLQVTEMFRPVGLLLGFPDSRAINVAFLVMWIAYVLLRLSTFLRLLRSALVQAWLACLIVVPGLIYFLQFLNGTLSVDRAIYWFSFSLSFALLFAVCVLLWTRLTPRGSTRFFVWCIVGS